MTCLITVPHDVLHWGSIVLIAAVLIIGVLMIHTVRSVEPPKKVDRPDPSPHHVHVIETDDD